MKNIHFRHISLLALCATLFTNAIGCGAPPKPSTPPSGCGQDTQTQCARMGDIAHNDDKYDRASGIQELTIPLSEPKATDFNYSIKVIDSYGANIATQFKDAYKQGFFKLILEFKGWKKADSDAPVDKIEIFAWNTKKIEANGETKLIKGNQSFLVGEGTVDKTTHMIKTGKQDVHIDFPIFATTIPMTLQSTTFEGKVTADKDGVKIENGRIEAILDGNAFLKSLMAFLRKECLPASGCLDSIASDSDVSHFGERADIIALDGGLDASKITNVQNLKNSTPLCDANATMVTQCDKVPNKDFIVACKNFNAICSGTYHTGTFMGDVKTGGIGLATVFKGKPQLVFSLKGEQVKIVGTEP